MSHSYMDVLCLSNVCVHWITVFIYALHSNKCVRCIYVLYKKKAKNVCVTSMRCVLMRYIFRVDVCIAFMSLCVHCI